MCGLGDNNKSEGNGTRMNKDTGEERICSGKRKYPSWAGAENIFRGEVGARAKNIKLDYIVEGLKYHRGTD